MYNKISLLLNDFISIYKKSLPINKLVNRSVFVNRNEFINEKEL